MRQTQERLIGLPILRALTSRFRRRGAEQRLLAFLEHWRGRSATEQGFGPGSVVNLLRLLCGGDPRALDLSRVSIRQAYLADGEAQGVSLAGAHVVESVLAEAFQPPLLVALSGDGARLAVGTSAGEVWLFTVADRTPLVAIQAHSGATWGVALAADGRLLARQAQVPAAATVDRAQAGAPSAGAARSAVPPI